MKKFKKGDRVRIKEDCVHINSEFHGVAGTVKECHNWIPQPMYIVKLDKKSTNGFTELAMLENELEKI
jgi:hypothetical protein